MDDAKLNAGKWIVDAELVRRLVAEQFPRWAGLEVRPVENDGWDNWTFHLGDDLVARLPSAAGYAGQALKEQRWLPWLAERLPLPIPVPLALGRPGAGYPWHWSVYRWLDGDFATHARVPDLPAFAAQVGAFLAALQELDPSGGPPPGEQNFHRGGDLAVYDGETRRALSALEGVIDTRLATEVWDAALRARFNGPPVWVHGDVAATNLLVRDGRLHAVIDFGCCCVGDPACDLALAWTFFSGQSRAAFRAALPLDEGAWARGRGWALWKGLIILSAQAQTKPLEAATARRALDEVLGDHSSGL